MKILELSHIIKFNNEIQTDRNVLWINNEIKNDQFEES